MDRELVARNCISNNIFGKPFFCLLCIMKRLAFILFFVLNFVFSGLWANQFAQSEVILFHESEPSILPKDLLLAYNLFHPTKLPVSNDLHQIKQTPQRVMHACFITFNPEYSTFLSFYLHNVAIPKSVFTQSNYFSVNEKRGPPLS